MDLGLKLKSLRKQNNLTLKELSQKSGISISFISDIEHGRRNPSIEKLSILSRALGVSENEFFSNTEIHTFGDRLKHLRQEKGVLQKDVANYLNITASAYGFYEQGKRVPDAETITKLAKYFNVSTDYLLNNDTKNIPEMKVPKEYTDKYKVTSRDKKQFAEEIRKANEAFFMDDELDESAKKGMLDLISEMFWDAKLKNKRVKKDK